MTTHDSAHPQGYKKYFVIWCWLLFMTLLALGLGYVQAIQGGVKAILLVGITLAKIFLIGSIFMHLKTERINLIMITFSPLLLSIVLFFFTFGETMGIVPTHKIENISPDAKIPGYNAPMKTKHGEGEAHPAAEAPSSSEEKK